MRALLVAIGVFASGCDVTSDLRIVNEYLDSVFSVRVDDGPLIADAVEVAGGEDHTLPGAIEAASGSTAHLRVQIETDGQTHDFTPLRFNMRRDGTLSLLYELDDEGERVRIAIDWGDPESNGTTGDDDDAPCCRVCGPGSKACGDTCINSAFDCDTPPGCACEG